MNLKFSSPIKFLYQTEFDRVVLTTEKKNSFLLHGKRHEIVVNAKQKIQLVTKIGIWNTCLRLNFASYIDLHMSLLTVYDTRTFLVHCMRCHTENGVKQKIQSETKRWICLSCLQLNFLYCIEIHAWNLTVEDSRSFLAHCKHYHMEPDRRNKNPGGTFEQKIQPEVLVSDWLTSGSAHSERSKAFSASL